MAIKNIRWWLIHGPERSGTTFMNDLVASDSKQFVSDWGLSNILKLTRDLKYILFDNERALRDICNNILDNAKSSGGSTLDLVFKQAGLTLDEYNRLVEMWGEPERKIFCLREPASYMSSVIKKFSHKPISASQNRYIGILKKYEEIGGEIFEYGPNTTLDEYIDFVRPLKIDKDKFDFKYTGKSNNELVTQEMWDAYERIKNLKK